MTNSEHCSRNPFTWLNHHLTSRERRDEDSPVVVDCWDVYGDISLGGGWCGGDKLSPCRVSPTPPSVLLSRLVGAGEWRAGWPVLRAQM